MGHGCSAPGHPGRHFEIAGVQPVQRPATGEVVGSTGQGRITGAARADFATAAAAFTADGTESRTYELSGPSFTPA